ncbi:MAG: hypothetical protein R2828_35655 [Saprospiraceae bacterium]
MSFSERLKVLVESEFSSGRSFAMEIDVNPKTINNIINNNNSPNYSVVEKILLGIPDLSAEWLCRGNGLMWLSDTGKREQPLSAELKQPDTTESDDLNWDDLVKEVKKLRRDLDNIMPNQ